MTAVTTYATLLTRLANDCNRIGDADFLTACPGFIQSGEAEMQRRLRVRQMIGRSTATIDNEYELVPTDFAGVRSFELDTTPKRSLEYVTPDMLTGLKGNYSTAANPIYYSIVGEEFQFLPPPGSGMTGSLSYWRRIPALGVSNTSNWLLLSSPDAYVYGAKVHAYDWLQDPERMMASAQAFATILDDITRNDAAESYGASMQTRSGNVI